MFKQSKWLWKTKEIKENSYGWFFKDIKIKDDFIDAVIQISAHNHFKLFINQECVSGFVTPAPSRVHAHKLFVSYDIKPYLKKGVNQIEVVVLYLGGHGQNYVNGVPGFILEGYVKTKIKTIKINSDKTWKTYDQIPYIDGMEFQQKRHITPVECYDDTIELDRSKVKEVIVLNGYKTYQKQEIPEGDIFECIEPKPVLKKDDVWVYDMGRIISGFVNIEALSQKNVELTIRYSEDLDNDRVKHNVANEYSDTYMDIIKLKANKRLNHQPDFTYKAFRYFEVVGKLDQLDYMDVKGVQAGTYINLEGSLSVEGDPYFNRLFEMFKHTQKNNILGQLVDCPHREQAQYLGDSLLQSLAISYNIVERRSLISKVLDDFMDAQYPDGTFPFVSPGNTDIDDFSLKIPEYDLYFIELVYQRYQLDYDLNIINKYQGAMIRLINHYLSKIDKHLKVVKKNKEWHISDWPYPKVDESKNYLTYENMLFYRVMSLYINMFDHQDTTEYFKTFLDNFRLNIIKVFKHDGLFVDSHQSKSKHQGIQAFALLNGFFEAHEVNDVLDYIIAQGFDSSIIFGRYVVEALFEFDRFDDAYTYMFEKDKGWGNIIKNGSLTMWEGFDDVESHSHAWGLYPVYFIQKYVLGIKTIDNDLSKIKIEPFFYNHIKEMSGSIVLNNGVLKVALKIVKDKLTIDLDLPKTVSVIFKYKHIVAVLSMSGSYMFNI